MNGADGQPGRWAGGRWAAGIAALFLVQLALVFFLGSPAAARRVAMPVEPVLRVIPPALLESRLGLARDPMLFTLPDPNGFSGSAWLNISPRGYEMPDWTESPRWLRLGPENLGAEFLRYARAVPTWSFEVAERVVSQPGMLGLFVPEEVRPRRSRLVVSPVLAEHLAGAPDELPSWRHTGPLANTVVDIGVAADGEVLFARVGAQQGRAGRSGLAEADAHALHLARNLAFQPRGASGGDSAADVLWGRLVFEWHTEPPAPQSGTPL